MINGIGIDLIEIERIREVLYKQPRLVDRCLLYTSDAADE